MKLLKTIATAAVISTSLFAATPAEAFWGTGEGKAQEINNKHDKILIPATCK